MSNHSGHDLAGEVGQDLITAEVRVECELRVPVGTERDALADLLLGELRADESVDVDFSMCSVDLDPDGPERARPDEPSVPDRD